jgi:hypothetical protein
VYQQSSPSRHQSPFGIDPSWYRRHPYQRCSFLPLCLRHNQGRVCLDSVSEVTSPNAKPLISAPSGTSSRHDGIAVVDAVILNSKDIRYMSHSTTTTLLHVPSILPTSASFHFSSVLAKPTRYKARRTFVVIIRFSLTQK